METFFADGATLDVPFGVDFFSILVGVITGAIFACERKLDIVGTIVIALIAAYGGGIIRDLLLQDKGVYFMEYPYVILIFALVALFIFCFRGWFKDTGHFLFFADAVSVGLFALAGANKAFQCQQDLIMVVVLGTITSVGGGALRDLAVGETPKIFLRSNFYAVAGFAGALVFAIFAFLGINLLIAAIACVVVSVGLRYLSVYFDWKTSNSLDLSLKVDKGARNLKDKIVNYFAHATYDEPKKSKKLRKPKTKDRG